MHTRPSYLLIGAMLAAFAAIALSAYVAWRVTSPLPAAVVGQTGGVAVSPQVKIGGRFELTNHKGARVSDADFRGKLMFVYFGYAFCPDICPTELQNMGAALDAMGAAADAVQPIFITVDPERDTVAALADYVPNFHPRLVGLTGSRAEIDAVAALYRVYHAKVKDGSATDYLVDHTGYVYLMGRDGAFLTMFRSVTAPGKLAKTIASHLGAEK
jgi:protein SCO1/2